MSAYSRTSHPLPNVHNLPQAAPVCTRARAVPSLADETDEAGAPCIVVRVTWEPLDGSLDRRDGGAFRLGMGHRALARRFMGAIEAGKACVFDGVLRDANGKTYVSSSTRVLMRHLSADLHRLGF